MVSAREPFIGVAFGWVSLEPPRDEEFVGLKAYNFRRQADPSAWRMEEQEEQLKVASRVRLLKLTLIPLLPLSILGTYLVLIYSHLMANAPSPLQIYADPVEGVFLIWSFYGLILALLAYYSRIQRLIPTKQAILLAIIFIIYPVLSYLYILGLWLLNRPHEILEDESGEEKKTPGSVVTNSARN